MPSTQPAADPLLQIRELRKSFSAPVLSDFHLSVSRGEVHALVGSNGAGKSTLARILAGLLSPDSGRIDFLSHPYHPSSRREAQKCGITLMLQELNILPTLSVAENLFLDELPSRFGLIHKTKLNEMAHQALRRVGLHQLDPNTSASSLGVGQQQLVELARALASPCRLLILDEPTAALTAPETNLLFENIHALKSAGVSVLYISHRMEELRRICDRVSVLRDGRHIATLPMPEVSTSQLVELMAGSVIPSSRTTTHRSFGPPALRVRNLHNRSTLQDVSFEVHSGEILGISGLIGAGRTETLQAIFAHTPIHSGTVEILGTKTHFRKPSEAVSAGLALVPEDRKHHGVLLPQSIQVNATLATLKGLLLDPAAEKRTVESIVQRLAIKCDSTLQPISTLSGGNQQKTVLGRWLLADSKILLLDEPTRGIDVPAKEAIYALLRELAADGKAIVLVSSDIQELMTLCNRIAVMSSGRIVEEFLPHEWTPEKLTEAAFRSHLAAPPASTQLNEIAL